MTALLLALIYVVFISLGLPDGVFGGAWPAIYSSLDVSAGLGGLVTVLTTVMTVLSSLATTFLVRRLGIGWLLTISTLLTAGALIGFSWSHHFLAILLFAVPLGLGAGAIDSALNHYVATHFKAHHMNWLHASWGIGATIGPIVFAFALTQTGDWHAGFWQIGLVQAAIVGLLLLSLRLWRPNKSTTSPKPSQPLQQQSFGALLRQAKVRLAAVSFFLYVGIEVIVGFWLASYLVNIQLLAPETAALWTGFYYGAITTGRVLTGFVSLRVSSHSLVRFGIAIALVGILLLGLNLLPQLSLVGIALIGLGFAPVYPGLIHLTPERFGQQSAKVMSLQMAAGYVGASTFSPLLGLLGATTSFVAFIVMVALVMVVLLMVFERTDSSPSTTRS